MITNEQLADLCAVMLEHSESVYMGESFLEQINVGDTLPCEARAELWREILNAMIDSDVEELFHLLTGREFLDVLKECCIIPSDGNQEAYIPIMPWEMNAKQKEQPFDAMNALRFAAAARNALGSKDRAQFECPLCGGEAIASFAENDHLHAHCKQCDLRVME